MRGFIENLKSFNRKERFYLVGMALGNKEFNEFNVSRHFAEKLSETFGLHVPENAFCAMDYHLDWIYASLFLASKGNLNDIYPNTDRIITATQQDIDLLVTFQQAGEHHVIMLEAKGATPWVNGPLNSKAARLAVIFGEGGDRFESVIPHFAIVSPREPRWLNYNRWPEWMRHDNTVPWLKLQMPPGLRKISRCDKEGHSTQGGEYWQILNEKQGGPHG